jgi:dipicolinate synthase subunit A
MKGKLTMNKTLKIAFLGGDRRQHIAAVKLAGGRYGIYTFGVEGENESGILTASDTLDEAITGARAVILPLPVSSDGVELNIRGAGAEKLHLVDLADAIEEKSIVIGGKLPAAFRDRLLSRGIRCYDYFESESFQIKNAYTTAEAALSIAMEKLERTVYGSDFAITGYGRIAKQLAALLLSLGGKVTVCARKESDLAWAELSGCRTLKINSENKDGIEPLLFGYDVIFNTVPAWLFDASALERIDKRTLLIELASTPGGIDVLAAKRLHSNVLWAASLPGKYAPESAGELIADCVRKFLDGEVSV